MTFRQAVMILLVTAAWFGTQRMEMLGAFPDIGTTDGAAYANQARALVEGRGLEVRYVSNFYLPYDAPIARPDDHWPPGTALALAPFFWLFGVSAWTSKLWTVWVGVCLLPLTIAWFIEERGAPGWLALVGGLWAQVHTELIRGAAEPYGDLWLSCLTLAFVGAILRGGRGLWLAGFFGALMWWTKGSNVVVLAWLPLLAWVAHGRVCRDVMVGLLVMGVSAMPLVVLQISHYGQLQSTQVFVAGHQGLDPWVESHYRVYWDEEPPSLSDRFGREDRALARRMRKNLSAAVAMLTTGHRVHTGLEVVDANSWQSNIAAARQGLWSVAALLQVPAMMVLLAARTRVAWVVLLYAAAQIGLYVGIWVVLPRYLYPTMVLVVAMGLALLPTVLPEMEERWGRGVAALGVVLALLWHPMALQRSALHEIPADRGVQTMAAADWLTAHEPSAVVMTRGPWQLLFHGGDTLQAIPLPGTDDTEAMLRVLRHYRVTHLIEHSRWSGHGILEEAGVVFERPEGAPSGLWRVVLEP